MPTLASSAAGFTMSGQPRCRGNLVPSSQTANSGVRMPAAWKSCLASTLFRAIPSVVEGQPV